MTKHKISTPKTQHRAAELRHDLTPAEAKLWSRLRAHQVNGVGFRRQHAIGKYASTGSAQALPTFVPQVKS